MTAKHICIVIVGVIGLVFILAWGVSAEILGDYVSYKTCEDCHPDKVEGWLTTPHAHAFDTLKQQGEEKQTNPGCFKCHVVAFDVDGGFIDIDLTPELKDVQCESCHGPGAKHMESEDPADVVAQPGEGVCRVCHTSGQDINFNFAKKSRLVHGNEKRSDDNGTHQKSITANPANSANSTAGGRPDPRRQPQRQ